MTEQNDSTNPLYDAAYSLARDRGFRVFPLIPRQTLPLNKGWQENATHDVEDVDTIWTKAPTANVGVATGSYPHLQMKSLVVIDIDVKNGKDGIAALKALQYKHGAIPKTFSVRTPSGGFHAYFWYDGTVASSVCKLGNGIDVRAEGGLVVGPGSVTPKGTYTVIDDDDPIETLPKWLADLCGFPLPRAETQCAIEEMDTEGMLSAAKDYLLHAAPEAIQNAGGDATTFKVACSLKDRGLSEPAALELMLDHWNPNKAIPPWHPDELAKKVTNAYEYGKNAIGSATPEAAFSALPPPQRIQTASLSMPLSTLDPRPLPRRRWIFGHQLLRGKLTELIAPPGAGKSTYTMLMAMSIASGKDLIDTPVHERGRVLIWNNEDDEAEMRRRFYAAATHHAVTLEDITAPDGQPNIRFQSGESRLFRIASKTAENVVVPQDRDLLIEHMLEQHIDVLIVDPFAETHGANENDNAEMLRVAQMYREIAQKANAAVMIVHHTRKPPMSDATSHAGNMDSGRGASSIAGVARVVLTLYSMSKKDARNFSVPNDQRHLYARLDDAKANLSLIKHDPTWLKKVSVRLETTDTEGAKDTYVNLSGDTVTIEEVGTLESCTLINVTEAEEEALSLAHQDFLSFLEDYMKDRKRATTREVFKFIRTQEGYEGLNKRDGISYLKKVTTGHPWLGLIEQKGTKDDGSEGPVLTSVENFKLCFENNGFQISGQVSGQCPEGCPEKLSI